MKHMLLFQKVSSWYVSKELTKNIPCKTIQLRTQKKSYHSMSYYYNMCAKNKRSLKTLKRKLLTAELRTFKA